MSLYEVYKKCKELNEKYNCFITLVEPEKDEGIPVFVKDAICTRGIRTTGGSKILENYIPTFDATVIEKIKQKNGTIIGKMALDEFGHGTFCTNCAYLVPKNPQDPTRVCGGSSGGNACITKLLNDIFHVSIAESTGGSISCPACWCGVYGLTPTYGRVSRWGLLDYANSLDKIGVMGNNLNEIIFGINTIQGADNRDLTCIGGKEVKPDTNIKKIGVIKEMMVGDMVDVVWDTIHKLENEGIEYEEISLKYIKESLAAYYIVATAETSTNLAKYCGMRYGICEDPKGKHFDEYFSEIRSKYFGEETKRRILLGTFARMSGYRDAYYLKSLKIRTLLINEFKRAFKRFDVLVSPTMPVVAPKFEEIKDLTPIEMYQMDILTVPPNFAGIPMLNVPYGKVKGLTGGIHVLGDHFQENKILGLAEILKDV